MRKTIPIGSFRFINKVWLAVVFFIIVITIGLGLWVSIQTKEIFNISINDEYLGSTSTPDIVKNWVDAEKLEFEMQFPDVQYSSSKIEITPQRKFMGKINDDKVLKEIAELFSIEASGYKLLVEGKVVGTVKNKQIAQKALTTIESMYDPKNLKQEVMTLSYKNKQESKTELKSIKIVESIAFEKVTVDPSELLTENQLLRVLRGSNEKNIIYQVKAGDCISCLAQKFNISQKDILANNPWIKNDFIGIGDELDLTVNRALLSVRTEEISNETVSIPNGVQVTYDESMRRGTSKVINPGKPGLKKITINTIKVNGELVDEVLVGAEVIIKPIEKQIVQGSKVIPGIGTGSFGWPIVKPQITSEYGKRWGRQHEGIDTVSTNRNIFAADSGKVIYAAKNSGYGNHIIIDHQNGYQTLYAHLSKINVKRGDLIEKGDVIGIMGNTGRSTGVHLHFEVEKNNKQQNPMKFLD
ncbi:murein DD-endopeptidase MepM/ murein hydrolase activator NlpD [Cohnella sp. SGD-V74]|uniref:M23 family metallopeptidase n=1 Tax=unclassified Cohnella TaxID=2636738 RepID=UPI000D446D6A|nr:MULTISPECIES: M23 family metallopeptidase [unclassified Cohnella]PRX65058.1 murein DD-endopeptidase MepM/ murein hydrolase activator NlpD [Cohnella sp. SGD-V74]